MPSGVPCHPHCASITVTQSGLPFCSRSLSLSPSIPLSLSRCSTNTRVQSITKHVPFSAPAKRNADEMEEVIYIQLHIETSHLLAKWRTSCRSFPHSRHFPPLSFLLLAAPRPLSLFWQLSVPLQSAGNFLPRRVFRNFQLFCNVVKGIWKMSKLWKIKK